MKEVVKYCQQSGGALLVAPEHRMSLHLKWFELNRGEAREETAICRELTGLDRWHLGLKIHFKMQTPI